MRYWSWKGDPEGRRFCFTTEPRFECPWEQVPYEVRDMGTGETTITRRRPAETVGITFSIHVSDDVAEAARLLRVDGEKLIRIITARHRSEGGRERVDGKLTDRCKSCGAKMTNHGYSAYVERDWDPDRDEDPSGTQATSRAIASRIGFAPPAVRLKGVNGLKRSEARKWAYEQYTQAKAAVA